MTQDQGNGYVDNSASAPLNTQAYGFQKPAWQANAVLVGTVWIMAPQPPPKTFTLGESELGGPDVLG